MHKTLLRQIKKHIGQLEALSPQWQNLLTAISETYQHSDEDRQLVNRMIDLSSKEHQDQLEQLKESETLYRTLVETSPEAVTMADLHGTIIFASEQTLLLHGYEKVEELVGKNALVLIAQEDQKRATTVLNRTLVEGSARSVEYTLVKKDGSKFQAELSASLVRDAEGKPKAFIATTRDISDRNAKDASLKESEERYRTILSNLFDAIFVIDTHDVIQFVSPSCEIVLGYKPEEIIGTHGKELIDPKDIPTVLALLAQLVANIQITRPPILRMKHKDGSIRICECRVKFIKNKQGNRQAVINTRDITNQLKAEEELKARTHELELMNQTMIGREMKMVELKKENAELKHALEDRV